MGSSIAYGGLGNAAAPIVTSWVNRPSPASVHPGTLIAVSDYNYARFVSDGTYWRPVQGSVLIYSKWGSLASPLAVIQNSTAATFTLPGGAPKIPAGMILPNAKITIQSDSRKVGANGTANAFVRLGTAGNASDSAVVGLNVPIATNSDICLSSSARFSSSKTSFTSRNYIGDGTTSTANAGTAYDRTTQVNTDADMFFTFEVSAASASDVFNLVGCHIILEE